MATHTPWDGSNWDTASPDIDQAHGQSYLEVQDLRKGVGIRLDKEHVACASGSAGGEHMPGKCGVMLVCDDTADFTAYVDATTCPLGSIAYCISHANMWCITGDASSGAPDVTVIKLGPQSFCLGADYTWAGAQEFDGSVDFTGPINCDGSADFSDVAVTGDLTLAGKLIVDSSADFSDVALSGDFQPTACISDNGGFLDEDDMASDATASLASQQSIKKYVNDAAGHDGDGYAYFDIDGVKTKVYTKYLTGTTDADAETLVAHGITASKILAVNGIIQNSGGIYYAAENNQTSSTSVNFSIRYDANNIILTSVGTQMQGQAYRIKIDYY